MFPFEYWYWEVSYLFSFTILHVWHLFSWWPTSRVDFHLGLLLTVPCPSLNLCSFTFPQNKAPKSRGLGRQSSGRGVRPGSLTAPLADSRGPVALVAGHSPLQCPLTSAGAYLFTLLCSALKSIICLLFWDFRVSITGVTYFSSNKQPELLFLLPLFHINPFNWRRQKGV